MNNMSVAEFDIKNIEEWVLLLVGGIIIILKKFLKPFWRRMVFYQVLTEHKKLNELRAKETLTEAEKDIYIDIVEDILKF